MSRKEGRLPGQDHSRRPNSRNQVDRSGLQRTESPLVRRSELIRHRGTGSDGPQEEETKDSREERYDMVS